MLTAAGVPIRAGVPVLIYPGDTTLYDWGEKDMVPFEELPYTYNPECGFVASANNKVVSDDYPYYFGTWYALPNRINRIRELLEAEEKHSVESFKAMQSDQVSAFARRMTPVYVDVLDGNVDGIYAEALEILKSWDYNMDKSLAAPLIFDEMFAQLTHSIFRDELDDEQYKVFNSSLMLARNHIYNLAETMESLWCDDVTTNDRVENFSDNIIKAFIATIDTLNYKAGSELNSWRWGDFLTLTIMHPMGEVGIVNKLFNPNLGPFASGGSFHTIAVKRYNPGSNYKVVHGASERLVYSVGDWDNSRTVIPTGTSGVPASPYYGNQTKMYMNFEYHADPFSKEAVKRMGMYTAVFK